MREQINKGGFTGLEKVANEIQKQANVNERTAKLISTFKNTFEALQGTFINLSATIGSLFAPTLIKVFTKINNYLSKMQDWIEAHKTLATAIALTVGGVLGSLALLGIIAKIGSIFLSLTTAGFQVITMFSKLAFVIVRMIIPALNMLRMAFIANPLGLLITAISGAIIAGYLLWKNWDKITAWFKSHFPTAFKVVSTVINKITEAFKFVASLNLFEAGKKILTTLVDGIKSVANKPVEIMRNIVQRIRNLLPFSPAKEGPLKDLHRIKLIETIADAINPNPLIDKMSKAVSLAVLTPTRASTASNISVYIGKSEASNIASVLEKEIRKVLEKITRDNNRRKY